MKKKLVSAILAAVAASVLIPASTFAAPAQTDVSGTVTNKTSAVSGASVVVSCNSHIGTDTTDSSGGYLVVFNASDCPAGATINVTASKGSQSGHNSGTADAVTTKLSVALVNVSVPEYGLIGLAGAAIIGGGAFIVIRRRQLGEHQA